MTSSASSSSTTSVNIDNYCWYCDQRISSVDIRCAQCGRGFHLTRAQCNFGAGARARGQVPRAVHNLLHDRTGPCQVCTHLSLSKLNHDATSLPTLNKAIISAVETILECPKSGLFAKPVAKAYLNYDYFVANRMDFGTIKVMASRGQFESAEQFLVHLKMIRHNAKVYNKAKERLFQHATLLYEVGYAEYCKLSYCLECYARNARKAPVPSNEQEMIRICTIPHGLVLAPCVLEGETVYLPGKIVNYIPSEWISESHKVDVMFFGLHTITSNIEMEHCFALPEAKLYKPKLEQLNKQDLISQINSELEQHVELLLKRQRGLEPKSRKQLPERAPKDIEIFAPEKTILKHRGLYLVKGLFRTNIPEDEGGQSVNKTSAHQTPKIAPKQRKSPQGISLARRMSVLISNSEITSQTENPNNSNDNITPPGTSRKVSNFISPETNTKSDLKSISFETSSVSRRTKAFKNKATTQVLTNDNHSIEIKSPESLEPEPKIPKTRNRKIIQRPNIPQIEHKQKTKKRPFLNKIDDKGDLPTGMTVEEIQSRLRKLLQKSESNNLDIKYDNQKLRKSSPKKRSNKKAKSTPCQKEPIIWNGIKMGEKPKIPENANFPKKELILGDDQSCIQIFRNSSKKDCFNFLAEHDQEEDGEVAGMRMILQAKIKQIMNKANLINQKHEQLERLKDGEKILNAVSKLGKPNRTLARKNPGARRQQQQRSK